MERLIDAGALVERIHEICQFDWNKKAAPISWVHAYESFEEDLDAAPTVDAIPVAWLQEKIRSEYESDSKAALRVLRMWEKDQEAR